MKTLRDFNFKDKKVLVRCDFNVPLNEEGEILDGFRIRQAIPTIEYLIRERAKIILMSHLDDPKGQIIENLRLTKIKEKLQELLRRPIVKFLDCVGEEIKKVIAVMQEGEVLILENLRFHKEEEENDQAFAKDLADMGEIYINEAFSCSHRSHASIAGVPQYLPSAAGLLLEKEIKTLAELIENPEKPLVAIIGGKKVETKSKIIDKISEIADWVIVGGLLKKEIEEKKLQFKYSQKIIGPLCQLDSPDIDLKTVEFFKEKISKAKTIFWNGPFGRIEDEEFQKGTEEIAKAIVDSGATSIVGGGETVEFIRKIGLMDKFTHISTGGGAMLSFLGGEKLPGLEALK